MVQSVELLLDPATEDAVVAAWHDLVAAGLPSQARHTGATNRPHVTLAVADVLPEEVEGPLGAALADLPLPVRLGAPVVLGSRRAVLALLVVPTPALLAVHAAVAAALEGCPGTSDLLRPGRWTPHVTLARGLDDRGLGAALAAVRPSARALADRPATLVSARHWDGVRRVVRPLG